MPLPLAELLLTLAKTRPVQETLAGALAGTVSAGASDAIDATIPQQADLLAKALLSSPLANVIDAAGTGIQNLTSDVMSNSFFSGGGDPLGGELAPNHPRRQNHGASGTFDLNATLLAVATAAPGQSVPATPSYSTFSDAASSGGDYTKSKTPAPVGRTAPGQSADGISLDKPKSHLFTNVQAAADEALPGQKVIWIGQKPITIADPAVSVADPAFNPQVNASGLALLTKALQEATDPQEQLKIAFQLKQQAQVQLSFNYGKYTKTAEAQFGVSDLTASIANLKSAETVDPMNPRTGAMSKPRFDTMQALGVAQEHVKSKVEELLKNDPVVTNALKLADSTIEFLKTSTALEGRDLIQQEKQAKIDAREGAIASNLNNPSLISRLAAVTTGEFLPQPATRQALATQLADGKVKFKGDEQFLLGASTDIIQQYVTLTSDKAKQAVALNILKADEIIALKGNVKQADINMALMKNALSVDLTDPKIPEIYRAQWKQVQTMALSQVGISQKEKDKELAVKGLNIKMGLLKTQVEGLFTNNPQAWDGAIKADQTAKAIFDGAKVPMDASSFINSYLHYNDGKPLQQKITTLRSFVKNAADAWPISAILPNPTPDSLLQRVDRIAVQAIISARRLDTFNIIGRGINDAYHTLIGQ